MIISLLFSFLLFLIVSIGLYSFYKSIIINVFSRYSRYLFGIAGNGIVGNGKVGFNFAAADLTSNKYFFWFKK